MYHARVGQTSLADQALRLARVMAPPRGVRSPFAERAHVPEARPMQICRPAHGGSACRGFDLATAEFIAIPAGTIVPTWRAPQGMFAGGATIQIRLANGHYAIVYGRDFQRAPTAHVTETLASARRSSPRVAGSPFARIGQVFQGTISAEATLPTLRSHAEIDAWLHAELARIDRQCNQIISTTEANMGSCFRLIDPGLITTCLIEQGRRYRERIQAIQDFCDSLRDAARAFAGRAHAELDAKLRAGILTRPPTNAPRVTLPELPRSPLGPVTSATSALRPSPIGPVSQAQTSAASAATFLHPPFSAVVRGNAPPRFSRVGRWR